MARMASNVCCHAAVLIAAVAAIGQELPPDALANKVNTLLSTMANASDKKARTDAAQELVRMGKSAVPALVAAVKRKDATIRYHAVAILGGMAADGAAAVPDLIGAASSLKEDAGVRQRAIYSLGEIRADERRCVPFLLEMFQRGGPDLEELAGTALGKFGARAKPAVPVLTAMVEGRRGNLAIVVGILGKIGPEAKGAVTALQGLMSDPKYKELQPLVERTLEQIQTKPD